jgi:hypothetical protein
VAGPPRSHRRSLRGRRTALLSAAAVAAAGLGAVPFVMNANAGAVDLAHQALPAKDGWAASGSGTTGGSKADAAHTLHRRHPRRAGEGARLGHRLHPEDHQDQGHDRRQHGRRGQEADLRRLRLGHGLFTVGVPEGVRPGHVRQEGARGHAGEGPRGRPDQAEEEHRLPGPGQHHRRGRPGHQGRDHRRESAGAGRRQRHHPQPLPHRHRGLLPAVGPDGRFLRASGTPTTTR